MNASDRAKLLSKIKKCLRLSKSSNEHEAAAALRQARKLMDAAQITEQDLIASEAAEARVRARVSMNPPYYELMLANTVSSAIGVEAFFSPSHVLAGHWVFVGCGGSEEIASYAFVVLLRKLKCERTEYIAKHLRRCKRANKTDRANAFCLGWVSEVRAKIEVLAIKPESRTAIELYLRRYELKSSERTVSLQASRTSDYFKGREAGLDVDLRSPVSGRGQPEAIS